MAEEWKWEFALAEVVEHIRKGTRFLKMKRKTKNFLYKLYERDFKNQTAGVWEKHREKILKLSTLIGATAETITLHKFLNGNLPISPYLDTDSVCEACFLVSRMDCGHKSGVGTLGGFCHDIHCPNMDSDHFDKIIDEIKKSTGKLDAST